ncbi:MAG TPA: VWA domain-containing protein [Bryobacteraceae bacterium]|nr:VWA domain-containing protein [Bryobacteraceae bacterium]
MYRLHGAIALPLLLIASSRSSAPQELTDHRISVNVDLVVLQATVRDRKGRLAPDLREQDFEIYEDGVRQTIHLFRHEDTPVTVGLVVDHSGSMRPKLPEVMAAAATFAQASSTQDEMFVVNFNEKVSMGLPEEIPFTNRSDELARAISTAPATGQTALYDAVLVAQRRLQSGNRDKKVLIIISDGGDNASKHSLEEVVKTAAESTTQMYTVGIFDDGDADRNPAVLRRLAVATGGEAFFPGQPGEVVSICKSIAHDIRHQYTLGYVPNQAAPPGAYRAIHVVAQAADRTKLIVRTRSGYIAARERAPVKDDPDK